ncbi:M56 family metallopeptidase [Thalassotalea sp. G2M2-11]|uniref:M56 family metallopeptidase n=1 Tax=Thalassotalea sp. G2M2-11 TaxID=2787627 RepID=UPI0019D069A9|nr:M56 family metallopeptidase [Thalassotalea sp. G2M2-11]
MMESFIDSPQWYNLALTLIHFIWQGGLIALALKILLILTPYHKAQLRYTWATLAMLASLIVPVVTFIAIYQPDYQPISYFSSDISTIINQQTFTDKDTITWYQEIFDVLPYISLLWLATVGLLSSKLLIELYNVNRLPQVASMAPTQELTERFAELVRKVGLRKTPRLLISLQTDIPMALGWLKPVVLIPASMLSGLTPAQLDMLILHELAHVRRHDYLVNFIQTIVETLLFFHPAVSWISKQMRNEREYCSDDVAVKISGNPIAYARTLADTASLCHQHRHHAIPNMAMAASGGDLKQRVVRLVDQHHCSAKNDSGKFLATVLIVFSVVAVFIKPYLNANVIDLTSGHISFFQTANDFIQKKPVSAGSLSATSIARLLLQKDKEGLVEPDEQVIATAKQTIIKDKNSAVEKVVKLADKPVTSTTDETGNQALSAQASTEDEQLIALTVEQNTSKSSKSSVTEQLLTEQMEQSTADQAFERTDSHRQKSQIHNPYAEQVADLVNTPTYQDNQSENKPVAVAPAKTSPKPIKKRPRYTITRAQQPEQKQTVNIRKPAEIIASPDPRYPTNAKRRGLELDVKINFTIDKQGRVKDIVFEEKSKVNYFRNAIRNALSKWRFLPAKYNGKPIESSMSKIFSFSLMR